MNSVTLPKARGNKKGNSESRLPSGRVSSLQDLSHKGRIISGRNATKSKRVSSNPRGDLFVGREDDANSSFGEENLIRFHENKNTILSNFEEWIKLSTDNKITSKNSWQFALIDYFHDLNVIKDGEDINFQRASATLDGCVKIYLSRVESVATETGKLLSGLATKKAQADLVNASNGENDGEESQDEINEEGCEGRKKRKVNRVVESTLVSFQSIQIKKLDQELTIDPLFKKALAEFDEGGSRSLLLNSLSINTDGKVVFDATSVPSEDINTTSKQNCIGGNDGNELDSQVLNLRKFIYDENDNDLNKLTICPSLGQLVLALDNIQGAKSVLGDMNEKYLNEEREGRELISSMKAEDFDDVDVGGFDIDEMGGDPGFDNYDDVNLAVNDGVDKEGYIANNEKVKGNIMNRDLMAYFDGQIKGNWRGPEHWKVSELKKSRGFTENSKKETLTEGPTGSRKKEVKIINFFEESDEEEEEELFETPKNTLSTMKKPDSDSDNDHNMLPEDIRYNSERLINLFLKPHTPILYFSQSREQENNHSKPLTDASFFAKQYDEQALKSNEERISTSMHQADLEEVSELGLDNGFEGIDFNDALDGGTLMNDEEVQRPPQNDLTKLINTERKARPEYVNFSRIAKRVDVRLLKDNIWRSINTEHSSETRKSYDGFTNDGKGKKFGELVNDVRRMYGSDERKDLSTSFYFICLLHLANEHGFNIESNVSHDDLEIVW